MSQRITITIDGQDGKVLPEIAFAILERVFETLQSIDANSWAVGARRLQWSVADASVKNPFSLTYSGDLRIPASSAVPDIAALFVRGCKEIETDGTQPQFFSTEDVKRMEEIGKYAKYLRSLEFQNGEAVHTVQSSVLRDRASGILDNPEIVASHGSLQGTLVSLQNYPDKPGAHAILLTRIGEHKTSCSLTPPQADELNDYVDRKSRVVLYGKITYENSIPTAVKVENFAIIPPDDKLPTLDDVRAMHLTVPNGVSIEDFISGMRDGD